MASKRAAAIKEQQEREAEALRLATLEQRIALLEETVAQLTATLGKQADAPKRGK